MARLMASNTLLVLPVEVVKNRSKEVVVLVFILSIGGHSHADVPHDVKANLIQLMLSISLHLLESSYLEVLWIGYRGVPKSFFFVKLRDSTLCPDVVVRD